MNTWESLIAARELVVREAALLDRRDWDSWLALYMETAEYWLPCWLDEYEPTSDPLTQISLIYYSSRAGLEDRVFRIRTEKSLASMPLPRTSRLLTILSSDVTAEGDIVVESNWATFSYKLDETSYFYGHQRHVLRHAGEGLRILKRKIIVMNDKIPSLLDIYSV